MPSQREEDKYILDYFKNNDTGTFLDVGGFHPETFSNVQGLFDKGWDGVIVEPSPNCYPTLRDFYKGTGIEVFNCAIGNKTEQIEFWDSNGDAISSTDPEHVKKWERDYDCTFEKIKVQCFTLEDLIEQSTYKSFNFVSIDVENDKLGIDILKQVDLYSVGMVCLECSYDLRSEVRSYMAGWKEIYSNAENILLCR